jgi:hypothetical protein
VVYVGLPFLPFHLLRMCVTERKMDVEYAKVTGVYMKDRSTAGQLPVKLTD